MSCTRGDVPKCGAKVQKRLQMTKFAKNRSKFLNFPKFLVLLHENI